MGSTVPGFKIAEDPSKINESADYVLILYYKEDFVVEVGALGKIMLKKGTYGYCGSAKAGLWGRVKRHFSDPLKKRWHIDHITHFSSGKSVIWKEHEDDGECKAAHHLSDKNECVAGFGCSDCSCRSHLFYLGEKDLTLKIM